MDHFSRCQEIRTSTSFNLNSIKDRDINKFKNFDKYQSIWLENLNGIEAKRNRLNNSALCTNYKVNKE